MKTTLITVCIISLFAGAAASSFTDGMATGFIAGNIGRKFKTKTSKKSFIKYNNFTRDTSLQKFPPVSSPQCILEKIKIVPPPLTIGQRIFTTFIIFLILCSFMHLLFFGTEKERDWFIGYLIGNMIEEMFNDDG
jgi:hypothetical protein